MVGYYPQSNGGVNWVQGESAARSWLLAPNSSVLLMDSEQPRFYYKQTDMYGMPLPLRIFQYTEITQTPQNGTLPIGKESTPEYVTKAEFDAFKLAIRGDTNVPNAKQPATV